jgi:hypothetical protein
MYPWNARKRPTSGGGVLRPGGIKTAGFYKEFFAFRESPSAASKCAKNTHATHMYKTAF